MTELENAQAALRWYATQAQAVAAHAASSTGTDRLLAVIQTLAKDAGDRANQVLTPKETA